MIERACTEDITMEYGAIIDNLAKMGPAQLEQTEAYLFGEVTKAQEALGKVRARMAAHQDVLRKATGIPAVLVDQAEVDRMVREARDRAEFEQRLAKRRSSDDAHPEDAFRPSRLKPILPSFAWGIQR